MAIAYVGKGAFASATTGDLVVPQRSGVAQGNLLLLLVNTANQPVSAPSGWAETVGSPSGQGTAAASTGATAIQAYWKIAGASEGSVTVSGTSSYKTGIILEFSGADWTTPVDVAAAAQKTAATGTALTLPGVTTTVDNAIVVLAIGLDRDAASTAELSGWTNTNLTSLTEQHDQTVTSGVGGGIAVATGFKATAGATGTTSATLANATTVSYLTIALKPRVLAKTSTLTDDFTADTLDSAKWTDFSAGTFSLAGDVLSLPGTGTYPNITSTNFHDLTGSSVTLEVPDPGPIATVTNFEVLVTVWGTVSLYDYTFRFGYGELTAAGRENSSSLTSYASVAYNATNHRWIRLREAGGTIYWETSANGTSWTTLHSKAAHFASESVKIMLQAGKWDWVSGDPVYTASFDNINLPPSAAGTVSGSAAQTLALPASAAVAAIKGAAAAAQTLALPASAAVAGARVATTAAQTLTQPASAASGSPRASAAAAQAQALPVSLLAAAASVAGTGTQPLALPASAATAGAKIAASGAQALAAPSSAVTGAAGVSAAHGQVIGLPDSVSAAGVAIAAAAAATQALPVSTAAGTVQQLGAVSAQAAQTLAAPVSTASAGALVAANAAQAVAAAVSSAGGAIKVQALAGQALAAPASAATGTVTAGAGVSGSAAQILLLPANDNRGSVRIAGTATQSLARPSSRAVGQSPQQDTDAIALRGVAVTETVLVGVLVAETPLRGVIEVETVLEGIAA